MSKNLANCTPDEFLDQSFLIMNAVEKFMKVNDILGIRSRKVEAASNMLLYSDFSIGQISAILSFSSTSHFIRVFRQETGLTPKVFQEQNYHNRRSMLKS